MNSQEIAKCARRLRSRVPLLGPRLRRAACRRLAKDPSADVEVDERMTVEVGETAIELDLEG